MPTENKLISTRIHNFEFLLKPPEAPVKYNPLLMIHGWRGDEKSMWVFARQLTQNRWFLAPRGPIILPDGGYGWAPLRDNSNNHLEDFRPILADLYTALQKVCSTYSIPPSNLDLMGFSQGAAVVYALLAEYSESFQRVAVLSGYIPSGAEQYFFYPALYGKNIFIAHGTRDTTIPISKAIHAEQILSASGATVEFCQANAPHKLSLTCLHNLGQFFL